MRRGRRGSVRGRQTERSPGAVRQRLHPAQPADRAAAHHGEEAGLLREDQQPGVPLRHLSPPAALLLPRHVHLAAPKVAPAVVGGPLLLGGALPAAPSASTHAIRGQRHPETLLTVACRPQERLPRHTQSLPTVPHGAAQGDQRQGISLFRLCRVISLFSFFFSFLCERLVFLLCFSCV